MIRLTKLRELDLAATDDTTLPRHLSAASGLVCIGSFIYVVADDELHLGVFNATDDSPGHLLRLFDGELPEEKAARKKQKPDFEAIVRLPAFASYKHGALLALGSASKRKRHRCALLGLDDHGAINAAPRVIDCSPLFNDLDERIPALNIEGAVVAGDEFRLLQRASKKHPQNMIVRYPLAAILDALAAGDSVGAITPTAIDTFELGRIDGIPLSITDAASLADNAMVFTAVAEDTEDTYDDGACLGAAIGVIARDGTVQFLEQIEDRPKVEGIAAHVDDDNHVTRLLLVSDADDPTIPAALFSTTLPTSAY